MLQGKITKNVEREILNHSLLIHPHVVRFEECFLTPKYLAIAMEYAEGGTMYSHVTSKCARGLLTFCPTHIWF
jgi:serine/threonine-protein kinase SRK2